MVSWWQGFWAIARKEVLQSSRRKALLPTLVFSQCLEFMAMGSIDTTVREMPTVIVDQDHTDQSRELIQRLAATNTFNLKYATTSTDQARDHIRSGRARCAIVIPPDYGRMRASDGTAHILTLVDGSDSAASGEAAASVDGVAARMNLEAQEETVDAAPNVSPHSVLLFNPQGNTAAFILPGLLAVILAEWYMSFGMQTLASERDAGNLERLVMTPMNFTALILGKLAPFFALGLLNGVVYLLAIRFVVGIPIRGSVLFVIVSMVFYLLTCVSIGGFVAAGARSMQDAQQTFFFIYFPVMWCSGFIFPLSSLPKALLPLAYAMPQTHFIEIMRAICLRGASPGDLIPHLVYLVVAPFIFTIGAVRRLSQSVMQ